jgi:AcrR family transcriptional regulator
LEQHSTSLHIVVAVAGIDTVLNHTVVNQRCGSDLDVKQGQQIVPPTEDTDTIQSILAAARQLFNTPGYTSARVADIAKLAGVSRATIYNNFEDKRAILNQLVRNYMAGYEEIGLRLQMATKPTDSIFTLLGNMLHDALLWRIENADLRPAIEVAKQLPGSIWTEANHAADLAIHGWIARIHHASSTHGVTLPDIDIDFATSALYSMIDATLSTLNVSTPSKEIDRIAEQLTLLQWHAIYTIPPDEALTAGEILPEFN